MSHSGRTFELNRNEKKHHHENYAYWQNKFGKYFEELYTTCGHPYILVYYAASICMSYQQIKAKNCSFDGSVGSWVASRRCALWRCCTCRTCVHCCDLTEIPEILRRFSPPLASKGNFEGFPSKTNNWILIKLHVSTTCNKSRSSYDVSSFSCSECGIDPFPHCWASYTGYLILKCEK